jgi:hypothetical protein
MKPLPHTYDVELAGGPEGDLSATGTVDRQDGRVRFTEIVRQPRLTVGPGADRARVMRVLERTERACLVSALLSTPIRLEPEIVGV